MQRPRGPRWKPGPQPPATWITSVPVPTGAGVIACAPGASINANAPAAANIDNVFISILQLQFCIVAPDALAPNDSSGSETRQPHDAGQRCYTTVVPWRKRGGARTKFFRRRREVQLRFILTTARLPPASCRTASTQPRLSSLKKSLPLSSVTMKAGKSSTSMRQIASMPSSGYSMHSTLLIECSARLAAVPPMEAR